MWKSLAIAYVAVPLVFYGADGIGHRIWPDTSLTWRISGQMVLFVFAVATFLALGASRTAQRSPVGAAIGACLGLVQLYPLYLEVGKRIFWEPAGVAPGAWQETAKLYSINLVFPIVTFSGSAYDGTFFTLPVVFAVLLLLGAFMASRAAIEQPSGSPTPTPHDERSGTSLTK